MASIRTDRNISTLLLATILGWALWMPAIAGPTLVVCTGTDQVYFSPGVTNQEQLVALSGQDSASCISLTHPQLSSVSDPFDGVVPLSCSALQLGGQEGAETLYWNGSDTQTSRWEYISYIELVNGTVVATISGPITRGVQSGARLNMVVTMLNTQLDACTRPGGLQTLSGPSQWVFTWP